MTTAHRLAAKHEESAPLVASTRTRPGWMDAALPVSLGLWALGISQAHVTAPDAYGPLTQLPIAYYAGIFLLLVSACVALARVHVSRLRMSLHASLLVFMLYGTAPLIYPQGRYAWLYKGIGVVQYINFHGRLNSSIDIYQNWPGFFALAAWFGRVAGTESPLDYAKWAQLVFELAVLPFLYMAYEALSLSVRQRWVALLMYSAGNWIGQDYYSPQALGTVLSLGIIAITLRWFYVGSPPGKRKPGDEPRPAQVKYWSLSRRFPPGRQRVVLFTVIALLYFVLTFTHELSPYLLVVQLGALAAARLIRPRWLPIALAAIAFAYLLPRFSFVNSHYGVLSSVGDLFRNAAPPSAGEKLSSSEHLIVLCQLALSVGMWLLALIGAWLNRRSARVAFALLLLAFSPIIVLLAEAYGSEGILRVYLFSLPWTAALASSAVLAPARVGLRRVWTFLRNHAATDMRAQDVNKRTAPPRILLAIAILLPLVIELTLFFPAFFGDDNYNMMSQAEVNTVTSFFDNARPGPVFLATGNSPVSDTFNYDLFPLAPVFDSPGIPAEEPDSLRIASTIAMTAIRYTGDSEPAYVVVTPSMIADNNAYQSILPGNFAVLLSSLAQSKDWKLVAGGSGTFIYELPPDPADHKSRVPGAAGYFSVP